MSSGQHTELDWLLDDLVRRVSGAEHVIVLSGDGLLMGRSAGLSRDDADHLAAVASGFQGLAKGTGRHFRAGQVRQTLVEMDEASLVVTAAGNGACLALLARDDADMGMIAYELNLLVRRVGTYLQAMPRAPLLGQRPEQP